MQLIGRGQPLDAELTALAALVSAADRLPYFTGSGTASLATFTSFARSILDDADEATFKATVNLEPGVDVQAYDAELAALAGLTSAANKVPYFTGSGTAAVADFTAGGRALVNSAGTADTFPYFSASNTVTLASITAAGLALLDDAAASNQRTTLGLGSGDSPTFTGLTLSGLTAGRVPYVSTAGLIADDSGFTWDATNNLLSITPSGAFPGSDPLAFSIERTLLTPPNTAPGAVNPLLGIYGTFAQSGAINQGRIGVFSSVGDDATVVNKTITGAANNGSGLIRITATGHGFATSDRISVYGVGGTTEANGVWTITVITADTFDLQSSTFSNAYTSGGTATNRGLYYAATFNVRPALDRDGVTLTGTAANGDDVAAVTISNDGAGKATDAIWITDASISGGSKAAWNSILSSDSDVDTFISYFGEIYSVGIDFSSATLATGAEPILKLGAGHNVQLDTGTGTKFGTATSQKIGFFNATPVVQNTSTTDLRTGLINLGFFASGGASPLNLNGGILTAAQGVISTGTITSSQPGLDLSQTWNSGGTTFTGIKSNITNTASASTSLLADLQVGSATRFSVDVGGALTQRGTDGASTVYTWDNHANTLTANTTINNFIARQSAGTFSTPLRTQATQTVLRLSASGYTAVDDSTTAAMVAAHKAAVDLVAGANDWTTSDNEMFIRFRATPAASTTTAAKAYITGTGIHIGATTAARGTTEPTNALTMYDGTAPVGTLTNGVTFYSASGEARVMDSAGNSTLLSPHDDDNLWIFDSVDTTTGKHLRIDVEKIMRFIDKKYKLNAVHESVH